MVLQSVKDAGTEDAGGPWTSRVLCLSIQRGLHALPCPTTSRSAGRLCGERSTPASGRSSSERLGNDRGLLRVRPRALRRSLANRTRRLRRGARITGIFRRHHPPRPRRHPAPHQPTPRVPRRREGCHSPDVSASAELRTFPTGVRVASSCAIWNQVGNADVADALWLRSCGSWQRRLPWRSRCKRSFADASAAEQPRCVFRLHH